MRHFMALLAAFLVASLACGGTNTQGQAADPGAIIVRCDDIGMCHTVNSTFAEVLKTGLPVSASVMFACPWYQEAVELLKQAPNVSVGVHLTLNAEWKNYRWGPVAGRSAVPSLVDSEGYFFPSRDLFFAHDPSLKEVELELRAQIERAVHSGLHIDYVDYHMGTAVSTPELRSIVEALAREFHLGISRYFGETDLEGWYPVPPEAKGDTVLEKLKGVQPGSIRLMVFHIGSETPEMSALVDMNSFGLKPVSRHRAAEFRALTSPGFIAAVRRLGIGMLTYRDVIQRVGLDHMKAPAGEE
ncbi:MAG: ChbG/HpnK family deacetylase [Bacteroidota bacterium]